MDDKQGRVDRKGKGRARQDGGRAKAGTGGRQARKLAFQQELEQLNAKLEELDPRSSSTPSKFSELPLSQATLEGLQSSYFHTLTPIQARSLPHALKGSDILGAARTGSGKTLAFLIPLLETLFRNKWGPNDGLGALVISPTRELAVQIFEVLRKIGKYHSFSAGLVIGGKNLKDEQERLTRMNILIATPGRLLQHMDQTISFDTGNLQLLVLDEADRILDMGFSKTLDAIVANLPPSNVRQTLLFSATQTSSISSLARLSMKRDPVYVSVRDKDNNVDQQKEHPDQQGSVTGTQGGEGSTQLAMETPKGLEQYYMLVDLDRKLDTLWTFIKSHLACKVLVFLSSGKQVRFAYEAFRHLRPGTSLLHIHGKQKQSKRLEIYSRFMGADKCVLFATDIAARGLDFPGVTWVVQVDCPEDVDTYVHRVGRTARYNAKGKALLFLTPDEEAGFTKRLQDRSMAGNVKSIKMNEKKKEQTLAKQFQSLAFQFPEIKFLAQKCFVSYVKSIYLQKDKLVFPKNGSELKGKLPLDRYAKSLGLPGTPKIGFGKDSDAKAAKENKNKERNLEALKQKLDKEEVDKSATKDGDATSSDSEDEELSDEDESEVEVETVVDQAEPVQQLKAVPSKTTKYDKMFARKNQDILSEHYRKLIEREENNAGSKASTSLLGPDDDDEDFITLARKGHGLPSAASEIDGEEDSEDFKLAQEDLSKRRAKLGITKKGLLKLRGQGEKLVFDDAGAPHAIYELLGEDTLGDVKEDREKFLQEEMERMKGVDVLDKEAMRDLKRDKKRKRKDREREVRLGRNDVDEEETGPMLAEIGSDEDGVKEIDFDLPSEDEHREPGSERHGKRARQASIAPEEDDLEAMALRALKKGRSRN